MPIALLFGSLALASLAWTTKLGGLGLLLLWPAAACALVATAYATNRPSMVGKRADGSVPWPLVLLYLPVLLALWGRWHTLRALGLEDPWVRIVPGLWLGRRPLAADLPPEVGLSSFGGYPHPASFGEQQ